MQVNGFSHDDKRQFIALFEQHRNPFVALEVLGVSATAYYTHQVRDPWFAEQVALVKRKLAWTRTPRLFAIADGDTGSAVTANIWLQKTLGGREFNPDARSTVEVQVSLAPPPTLIDPMSVPQRVSATVTLTRPGVVPPSSGGSDGVSEDGALTSPQRLSVFAAATPVAGERTEDASARGLQGSGLRGQGGEEYAAPLLPNAPSPKAVAPYKNPWRKPHVARTKAQRRYDIRRAYARSKRSECQLHPGIKHYKPCLGRRQNCNQKKIRATIAAREAQNSEGT